VQFNSIDYLIFLPLVALGVWSLPARWRWAGMLAASYVFYAWWNLGFTVLLFASTVLHYAAARMIAAAGDPRRRRWVLVAAIGCDLGLLGYFKYANFLLGIATGLSGGGEAPRLDILLPTAISFYTLQSIGYTVDVYRGKVAAERHFGRFAVFVAFFPQLVAGPIERAAHLLPQLRARWVPDAAQIGTGALLITWGLFKKLVVADRLAAFTDPVMADPAGFAPIQVLAAPFLFMYRLYCDFSGYSDIAVGSALIFGVHLVRNFDRPFAAVTLRGFWQRWHMSLTRWMIDFVYVPLARRSPDALGRGWITIASFTLLGLWHGAAWTFVLFGLLNGIMLVIGDRLPGLQRYGRLGRWATRVSYWCFLAFAVLFFASPGLSATWAALGRIAELRLDPAAVLVLLRAPPFSMYEWLLAIAGFAAVEVAEWLRARLSAGQRQRSVPALVGWAGFYAMLAGVLMFGVFTHTPFYYFRF
jgi:alginate O-acetyltransferase complex protein AlgI